MRVASLLGTGLLGTGLYSDRGGPPGAVGTAEALGLATMALLDHSWFDCRVRRLPVEDDDMIRTVASMIFSSIDATDRAVMP